MKMNQKNPNTTLVFCPLRVIPVVLITIAIVIIVKELLHWWNGSVTVLGLSPHGSAGFSFSCSFWLVTTFSDFGQCTNIYISHQMALIFGMTWPKQGEHQLLEPERAKQRAASAQPGTSAGKRQVDLYFNSRSPCFWISKNNNRLTTCRTSLKL